MKPELVTLSVPAPTLWCMSVAMFISSISCQGEEPCCEAIATAVRIQEAPEASQREHARAAVEFGMCNYSRLFDFPPRASQLKCSELAMATAPLHFPTTGIYGSAVCIPFHRPSAVCASPDRKSVV